MPRKRFADLWLLGALLAVIALLSALRSAQSGAPSMPSTYDTGPRGYAALYTLLQAEGLRVQQFEAPLSALASRGTLVVTGYGAAASLDGWVRGGGALVALGSQPWSTPKHARVVSAKHAVVAYRRGHGFVVYAPSAQMFDNSHLLDPGNAKLAYALFAALPASIAFDERIYGHAAGRSFWQVLPPAMHVAIVIACAALLLAAIGANLPFAPPYAAQESAQRDSGEYIASLAQMLERGRAEREIVARLCDETIALLQPRSGVDPQACELLSRARQLQSQASLGRANVLEAGTLFARARKDYA